MSDEELIADQLCNNESPSDEELIEFLNNNTDIATDIIIAIVNEERPRALRGEINNWDDIDWDDYVSGVEGNQDKYKLKLFHVNRNYLLNVKEMELLQYYRNEKIDFMAIQLRNNELKHLFNAFNSLLEKGILKIDFCKKLNTNGYRLNDFGHQVLLELPKMTYYTKGPITLKVTKNRDGNSN